MMSKFPDGETRGDLLIVGDIPVSLNFIPPLLTERGYTLFTTGDSDRALEIVRSSSVSLIVLSTALKTPDAYTICQRIRASVSGESPPILFLSGFDPAFQSSRVFQAGGADYIAYPASNEEILARVENQLAIARLRANLDRQSDQLQRTLQELQKLEDSMHQVYDELREFSFLDSLTRVSSRRRFEEYLEKEWQRCARDRVSWGDSDKTALSLILCDLDHFKDYNDSYGIAAGDECLKKIARVLESAIKRPADLVARYGGESFAVLLPNTDNEGALTVARSIRQEVSALRISHPNSPVSEYLTLSYGVVTAIPSRALGADTLTRAAQQALHLAKKEGRDRIMSDLL
jgi:diguanylate cyclase (GGDEF)-like protein